MHFCIWLKSIDMFAYYSKHMSNKDRITVTISPYLKNKLAKYVGKGKLFSSASDAAGIALTELFVKIEQEEKKEKESEK